MLTDSDERVSGDRPDLSRLLNRLSNESRAWSEAETALAKLELDSLKAQAVKIAVLAAIAFAAVLCVMLALTQSAIAGIAPFVGVAWAALLAALLFAAIAAGCVVMVRRAATWRTESIFFRWLGSRPAGGADA